MGLYKEQRKEHQEKKEGEGGSWREEITTLTLETPFSKATS